MRRETLLLVTRYRSPRVAASPSAGVLRLVFGDEFVLRISSESTQVGSLLALGRTLLLCRRSRLETARRRQAATRISSI